MQQNAHNGDEPFKEVFIADLIACSTCFGHHYAHHQELKSIIQWLLPVVFCAVASKPASCKGIHSIPSHSARYTRLPYRSQYAAIALTTPCTSFMQILLTNV